MLTFHEKEQPPTFQFSLSYRSKNVWFYDRRKKHYVFMVKKGLQQIVFDGRKFDLNIYHHFTAHRTILLAHLYIVLLFMIKMQKKKKSKLK